MSAARPTPCALPVTQWPVLRRRHAVPLRTCQLLGLASASAVVAWVVRLVLYIRLVWWKRKVREDVGNEAEEQGAKQASAMWTSWNAAIPKELLKTRPCRWYAVNRRCGYGDDCAFAHSAEELRPTPSYYRSPDAPHWCGDAVSIGVLEMALFTDLAPPGTLDVVCNRCTCLGNPFAARWYAENEERPQCDEHGWSPKEHDELCSAFDEYLTAVLSTESQEELCNVVKRIARKRSLAVSDCWSVQSLRRDDVCAALQAMELRAHAGVRLRLLCHCRPHVRCHTEFLKAHIEVKVGMLAGSPVPQEAEECRRSLKGFKDHWPSLHGDGPACAQCGRQARAMDPHSLQLYCAFCWQNYADNLQRHALKVNGKQTKWGGHSACNKQ